MKLEDQLIELSAKHPLKSLTMITLEYQQLQHDYQPPSDISLAYMRYKYDSIIAKEPPKGFLLWYVDYTVERTKIVREITKPCRPNTPYHPESTFDPHRFP